MRGPIHNVPPLISEVEIVLNPVTLRRPPECETRAPGQEDRIGRLRTHCRRLDDLEREIARLSEEKSLLLAELAREVS